MALGLRGVMNRLRQPLVGRRAEPSLTPLAHTLDGPPLNLERRSEDVRFSPSGRRLVVATTNNSLLLFDVDLSGATVSVMFNSELTSGDMIMPHGVDWIDEENVIVANRAWHLAFFHIPRKNRWEPKTAITIRRAVTSDWFGAPGEQRLLRERQVVTGPGSVRICGDVALVSCNKGNTVTAHRLTRDANGPGCDEGRLVAQTGIEIPDSAILSPDGRFLAVGDHDHHRVLLYRYGGAEPIGSLVDPALVYPHGISFDRTGDAILVADAGSPFLFVFAVPKGDWTEDQTNAAHVIEGVDQDVFDRVQAETPEAHRHLEGGAKGLSMAPDGRTVVTTCRGQTLRFFAYDAG